MTYRIHWPRFAAGLVACAVCGWFAQSTLDAVIGGALLGVLTVYGCLERES